MTRWKGSARPDGGESPLYPHSLNQPQIRAIMHESWFCGYGDSTSLEPRCWALQRSFLRRSTAGEQCYGLVNRPDGGLMSDVVGPDGVTAEWLTKVFAAARASGAAR
jgi:hypothetical protein